MGLEHGLVCGQELLEKENALCRVRHDAMELRLRNFQVRTNLLSEKVVDLSMAGDCGGFAGGAVDIDAVTAAFS